MINTSGYFNQKKQIWLKFAILQIYKNFKISRDPESQKPGSREIRDREIPGFHPGRISRLQTLLPMWTPLYSPHPYIAPALSIEKHYQ